VNPIAAVRLEQDRPWRQSVFHDDAGIETEIGADIDENVRLERAGRAHEVQELLVFGDPG